MFTVQLLNVLATLQCLCHADTYISEDVCLRAVAAYVRREDAKEAVRRCSDHTSIDQGAIGLLFIGWPVGSFIDLLLQKEELISSPVNTNRLFMTHLVGNCLSSCHILKANEEKVIRRDLSYDLAFV